MSTCHVRSLAPCFACLVLVACGGGAPGGAAQGQAAASAGAPEALRVAVTAHAVSFDYARFGEPIAGVAGGEDVVFVGEPLLGKVVALSRATGKQIGELPPPPGGFAVPFVLHALGEGRLGVLDAGGLPQPSAPANPTIYEYTYASSPRSGFSARLDRTVSFASVLVGFSEDFVRLQDGRYIVSDAVLGSIWVVETDGTIRPGIVPRTFDPADAIPALALCPTMPEITVNGQPFLFTASTLPGVSPLAERDGTVYFYSPCARGTYAFPLAALSDGRAPHERAADIRLVAATPPDVQVEELLAFAFDPFDPSDRWLYAADPLKLRVIRIDVGTGERQVVADDPRLFDFPSSLAFLPPSLEGVTTLVVASNQQERSPLTNDAVTETAFRTPFIVAKVFLGRAGSRGALAGAVRTSAGELDREGGARAGSALDLERAAVRLDDAAADVQAEP